MGGRERKLTKLSKFVNCIVRIAYRVLGDSSTRRFTGLPTCFTSYALVFSLGMGMWLFSGFAQVEQSERNVSDRGYLYIVTDPPDAIIKIDGELVQLKGSEQEADTSSRSKGY